MCSPIAVQPSSVTQPGGPMTIVRIYVASFSVAAVRLQLMIDCCAVPCTITWWSHDACTCKNAFGLKLVLNLIYLKSSFGMQGLPIWTTPFNFT